MSADGSAREDLARDRESLVRGAMTLDDQLDDIKRAQIWSRIERAVDARPARRLMWRPAFAFAAACAAATALWFVVRPRPDATALVAPVDATLTAQVGPHTRAELVGPARLEIVGTPGDATHVRLRKGTLVAEFTGGPGRSLHIDAPNAAIDIVGTLFAVEVTDAGTCVSVSHGKVAITSGDAKLAVSTGESWCSARRSTEPLAPALQERFERFTAVRVASTEPAAVTVTPIVPPPMVAPPPPVVAPPSPVVAPPSPATAVESPKPAVVIDNPTPPATRVAKSEAPKPLVAESKVPAVAEPKHVAVEEPKSVAVEEPKSVAVEEPKSVAVEEPKSVAVEDPKPVAVEEPKPVAVEQPKPVADPPKPPAAQPQPVPAPPTAETLYQAAEAALGKRDLAAADRALAALVTDFADSPLVDQAIYERAQIAYQRHAWSDARRQLEQLADRKSSALAEPGAYLACRIDVETHDDGSVACLAAYRRAYPSSPHGLDVLGLLVDIAYRDGGCAHAAGAIAELTRRYPHVKLTLAWQARCEAKP